MFFFSSFFFPSWYIEVDAEFLSSEPSNQQPDEIMEHSTIPSLPANEDDK